MAKRWKNRTAKEWRAVLEAHGFTQSASSRSHGDDEVWRKGELNIVILVPSRNSETIIEPTSCEMARKANILGLSKKTILQWWKDNGYGE